MNFWKDKTVAVTGGSGFLGSFVVERLHECNVKNVFVPRSSKYDLREKEDTARMLQESNPNYVIHLAAITGGIGANSINPARFFYDNAIMGIHLIEQARRFAVEKTLIVGTICSYPKFAKVPFNEKDLWSGYPEETNAPYGIAKKMLLVQAQAYREQYGMNIIYLLPVNLYGPRDNFDPEYSHVIAALIRKFIEAKTSGAKSVYAWGTGKPTREFIYVEDAAEAIITAMEHYDKPDPVNVGSQNEISIQDLAYLIKDLVGYKGEIIWDHLKPDGQPYRKLDISRAQHEFGFTAKMPFEEGLKRTIKWYQRKDVHVTV